MYYISLYIFHAVEKQSPLFVNKLSLHNRFKYYVLLIALTGFCGMYARHKKDDYVTNSISVPCSEANVLISAADIKPSGFSIEKEGTYCLTDDLFFEPDKPGRSAITINAKGVTLLLEGKTITQKGTTANTNGIMIAACGDANVMGGTISGFTGNGVYAIHCEGLFFQGVTSSNNLGGGINSTGQGATGNGFNLVGCQGVFLILCNALKNTGEGIWLQSCGALLLEGCSSEGNGKNYDIDIC